MLATVHTANHQSNGHARFQPPPAETIHAEKPTYSRARAKIAEIEQLWLQGYSTREIASELGEPARDVGRNLREIRKRHERAARRSQTLIVARCAEISNEAMAAWRRSQGTHQVVTTRQKDGCPDSVTTRVEEKPGNPAFLNAALRATKALGELAAQRPAASRAEVPVSHRAKTGTVPSLSQESSDAARLALAEILTPEQGSILSLQQREEFVVAYERWKELIAVINAANETDVEAPVHSETEQPRAPVEGESLPEVAAEESTTHAAANPDANDSAIPSGRDGDDTPAVRRIAALRHPEWPADSFLSRSWNAPDRGLTPDRRETAAFDEGFQAIELFSDADRVFGRDAAGISG